MSVDRTEVIALGQHISTYPLLVLYQVTVLYYRMVEARAIGKAEQQN
jgi:hypothetical protein